MPGPSLLSRLPLRYATYLTSIVGLVVSLAASMLSPTWGWAALVFALLVALGSYDLLQRRHTVSRLYPILAHIRYSLEAIGPEIRQYLIESDTAERPFSREQRSVIYQRAKNVVDKHAFGTVQDVYVEGYEWISHSLRAAPRSHRMTFA